MSMRGLSMSGAFQLPRAVTAVQWWRPAPPAATKAAAKTAAATKAAAKKGFDQVMCYAECASSGTRYCPLTVPSPVTRL